MIRELFHGRLLLPLALAATLCACGSGGADSVAAGNAASSSSAVSGASASSASSVTIQGVETPSSVSVVTANNAN